MFFYLPAIYTDLLENQIHATKDPPPNKRCILLINKKYSCYYIGQTLTPDYENILLTF